MDTFITELLKTGGPLGVLVVVVYIFLRYLASEAINNRAYLTEQAAINREFHERLQAENTQARAETREALKQNAVATADNTKALATFTATMGGFKRI